MTQSTSKGFLPRIGSPAYHVLLATVAIFILGPLGGVSAAFMNFSIGFYIGGQVLAGILGSAVTLPYGPDGKHGANYIQSMAASVAGMCGMGVLMQAMVWLGLPEPALWKLILFYMSIGMFGVGIGMLYTPLLVDRMQLTFPSGFAVANILRALTDRNLLKRSIAKLGGGMLTGYSVGWLALNLSWLEKIGFSSAAVKSMAGWNISISTFGAGAICGARIAIPALVVGLIGYWQTPNLVSIGWLKEGEPFRKIGFIIALGTILGAAIVDITLILIQAWKRYQEKSGETAAPAEDWKRVNMVNLLVWIVFWGAAVVILGNQVMNLPVKFLMIAVILCFFFVLINGISLGISDWNPISSAFVVTIFILAGFGLDQPAIGLMCGSILLIACSEGGDMQQDRSTGWRLGTNRVVQFRYQVIGIVMGAVLAVVLAKVFMNAYPELTRNQYDFPNAGGSQWQSTMTYKFVGALKGITEKNPHVMTAMWLGIGLGVFIEVARKLIKRSERYKMFVKSSPTGGVADFVIHSIILASPYASSFGGFAELPTIYWWAAGGVAGSLYSTFEEKRRQRAAKSSNDELPADMSTVSLAGGGLIAGESLAALTVGLYGLIAAGVLKKLFGG